MSYPKFGKTIEDYTAAIRENNIRLGWRVAAGGPGTNSFGDYIALLTEELGEATSAYRKHRLADATGDDLVSPDGIILPPKPEGVGSELADLFIRLLDTADVFGINLTAEVNRKIAYNATREFQHGGTMADESAHKSHYGVARSPEETAPDGRCEHDCGWTDCPQHGTQHNADSDVPPDVFPALGLDRGDAD